METHFPVSVFDGETGLGSSQRDGTSAAYAIMVEKINWFDLTF